MFIRRLRKTRVISGTIFITVTTLLFFDLNGHFIEYVNEAILFLQFVPSLINFSDLSKIASIGFIIILLINFLFGRVYCSFICPFGVLQDVIGFLKRKIKKKKKNKYLFTKPLNKTRYIILAATAVTFIFGNIFLLNLLDPYSLYGKFATNLFRPLIVLVNNLVASVLEQFDLYFLFPFEIKAYSSISIIFSLLVLISLVILVVLKGRLFCNSVCPVGTLLGLVSRFSFFKLKIDYDNCHGCGICERDCKASCIDSKAQAIDFSRCVACFSCIKSCPTGGIQYKMNDYFALSKSNPVPKDSRRRFVVSMITAFAGITGFTNVQKKILVYKENKIPVDRLVPVSPPGSLSIADFNEKCTACHLCVSACPTQVLQPAILEYGLFNIMQPRLDNSTGFCNFECKICTDVCPTGAIRSVELEAKKLIQIGKAKFIKDNCVVYTQGTECGACSEHCPTKAVKMVPDGKVLAPVVEEEFCIGCGACEFACPTKPYKSIYIEGNAMHQLAKKPKEEPKEKYNPAEEFPF